jgi:hypothetical protein
MLLSGEVTLDKDGKPSSGFACDFCHLKIVARGEKKDGD